MVCSAPPPRFLSDLLSAFTATAHPPEVFLPLEPSLFRMYGSAAFLYLKRWGIGSADRNDCSFSV